MTYGYCRVSTGHQTNDHQQQQIKAYCKENKIKIDSFVTETTSSKKHDRQIFNLVAKVKKNDKIIVFEFSRLARSIIELNKITSDLLTKQVELHVVATNLIIDNSIESQTLVFAFGLASQIERDMISERVTAGLKASKAKGVKLGRKKINYKNHELLPDIKKYVDLKINKADICKLVKISRGKLYKILEANGLHERG